MWGYEKGEESRTVGVISTMQLYVEIKMNKNEKDNWKIQWRKNYLMSFRTNNFNILSVHPQLSMFAIPKEFLLTASWELVNVASPILDITEL